MKNSIENCCLLVSDLKFWHFFVFQHKFCHAVLDSCEHQGLPPDFNSTSPDQLRSGIRTAGEEFPVFCPLFCSNIAKKSFLIGSPIQCADLNPKKSPCGGQTEQLLGEARLYIQVYKLAAPKKLFFCPPFVARIMTVLSRNSGYGLPLGCIGQQSSTRSGT